MITIPEHDGNIVDEDSAITTLHDKVKQSGGTITTKQAKKLRDEIRSIRHNMNKSFVSLKIMDDFLKDVINEK